MMPCNLSFALRSLRMSRLINANKATSKTKTSMEIAADSLYENACTSLVRRSFSASDAATCPSMRATSELSAAFNSALCHRILSAHASKYFECSLSFAAMSSPSRRRAVDRSTTCTVFLPPNSPASPFFFFLTVRTLTERSAMAGSRAVTSASKVSFRLAASITDRRCFSFSSNRQRSVSTCMGETRSRHSGFTDTRKLSTPSRSLLYAA